MAYFNGRSTSNASQLVQLVAADGTSGGFVKDSQIGTSGAAVPLLDGANTWSARQTFEGGAQLNNADSIIFTSTSNDQMRVANDGTNLFFNRHNNAGAYQATPITLSLTADTWSVAGAVSSAVGVAPPAGGGTTCGVKVSSTANLGWFVGTGAPSLSAAKGSLYSRTDATTTTTRLYINTDGGTTWTNFTTAA